MKLFLIAAFLFAVGIHAQNKGTQTPNYNIPFTFEECTAPGSCQSESGSIVLDSNWRWTHHINDYVNCYTGNEWDPTFCPDVQTCTDNCGIDGVSQGEWEGTYGISSSGSDLNIRFITEGQYSTNVGSRSYLLDNSGTSYKMFNLLNKEFTFTVDVSNLDCGLNGALYFVEMAADGGLAEFPDNDCGAEYGTGYCDAQCPHDMKWIDGRANSEDWAPSDNDPSSGAGHYGTCCMEFDIWEANRKSQAYTSHPCDTTGQESCEGIDCGDNNSDNRYDGVCDKDGCDFAAYRNGDTTFYGEGSSFVVDTTQPITVVTQFITSDGTENGDLVEIRRLYVQNGEVIENPTTEIDGQSYDSITDDFCNDSKTLFGEEINAHADKGGLTHMGEAFKRGMVLVMSMWDDHESYMLWLDSTFPPEADPNQPGVQRGPCPTTSGRPEDIEAQQPDASVNFSNIKYGPIGSTY